MSDHLLQPGEIFAGKKRRGRCSTRIGLGLTHRYWTRLEIVAKDNGTACSKNVNNCLNTNIYSYLGTSGGQSSNPYLNVVHFFNTRVD